MLHDVFVALPDALKRYEERGSCDAWLRTCLMRLRQLDAGDTSAGAVEEVPAARLSSAR